MTSDQHRLAGYVDTWKATVDEVVALLRGLSGDDWAAPTDLAGWDVRAVASHLAHIESELSGVEQPAVAVPELDHLTAPTSRWTEPGVIARRSVSSAEIVDELERSARVRQAELRDHPPTDGSADPPITPGGMPWNWETLLSNRCVDAWMHEQDIRRATGRPGGMNSPGAAHTIGVFTRSFGYAVGKRVAPQPGTTVVLDVRGVSPVHLAVEVNQAGRAVPAAAEPESPTVSLSMDLEAFTILSGGRRSPSEVAVDVTGDEGLGEKILAAMAVTP